MKNIIKSNGGYIGILFILLAVCLIVFIIVRTDIISPNNDGKNMIEQGQDSINKANNVVDFVEQRNKQIID